MSTDPGKSATVSGLQTDTEQAVAEIWADVLKKDSFDAGDDFFEIGGNSMLATLVTYRLREDFEVETPLMLIFENPTVAELAKAVDELRAA
jgi:acyl carrier protein